MAKSTTPPVPRALAMRRAQQKVSAAARELQRLGNKPTPAAPKEAKKKR